MPIFKAQLSLPHVVKLLSLKIYPSVCLSATFRYSVQTAKRIAERKLQIETTLAIITQATTHDIFVIY